MSEEYHEKYKVVEVVDEAKDLRRLIFNRGLEAEPGQYVMMWLPGVAEKPFSVMHDENLELGIRKVGPFTEKAFELGEGDDVLIRGPYGNSFMDHVKEGGRKHIVCGGCGSVPMEFLANRLFSEGHDVSVLVGAGTEEELPKYFRRFHAIRTTDDGSAGLKGVVTEHMDKVTIKEGDRIYMCGPEKMMVAAAEEAEKYVGDEDIVLSMERYMKCGGRGICGSCEMDGLRVCVDGPVFTYKDLKGGDFGRWTREKSGRRVSI